MPNHSIQRFCSASASAGPNARERARGAQRGHHPRMTASVVATALITHSFKGRRSEVGRSLRAAIRDTINSTRADISTGLGPARNRAELHERCPCAKAHDFGKSWRNAQANVTNGTRMLAPGSPAGHRVGREAAPFAGGGRGGEAECLDRWFSSSLRGGRRARGGARGCVSGEDFSLSPERRVGRR